jgi:prepilin-type N-terminal cleavage/methylation domain-containing protein
MKRAFSLLEVMIAVAILAIGLVVLLQVQTRSVMLAQEARDMTVATMLARGKLLDCQADLVKKGFSVGDYDEQGTFDEEGYAQFSWECHGYKPDMPVADTADITQAMSGGGDDAPAQPGADMGMQFLAPIMSQMSSILGDSIRELVVIVRWGSGDETQEMRVTTHVIDKTAVNQVAAMIQAQTRSLPGGGGGGRSSGGVNDADRGPRGPQRPGPGGPQLNPSGPQGVPKG